MSGSAGRGGLHIFIVIPEKVVALKTNNGGVFFISQLLKKCHPERSEGSMAELINRFLTTLGMTILDNFLLNFTISLLFSVVY